MALIRQRDADRIARDAIVLDLGDLRRQGEDLVAQARAKAAVILQEAQREREALVRTGHAEGFARGLQEGRTEGHSRGLEAGTSEAHGARKAELARIEAGWTAALSGFLGEREGLMASAREDLLRLAIEIARRATTRLLVSDPRVTGDLMSEAIASAARATRLVVCVHPDDELICRAVLPALMATFPECEHAEIRPDGALARGSVVVRTPAGGEVDASVSTRLDRIARALVPASDADAEVVAAQGAQQVAKHGAAQERGA